MRFIVGLFAIGMGILFIKYRKIILDWTGHWSWAETYVGGTANAIILIGLVIIFLGVTYPTGALDRYLGSPQGNIGSSPSSMILPSNQ